MNIFNKLRSLMKSDNESLLEQQLSDLAFNFEKFRKETNRVIKSQNKEIQELKKIVEVLDEHHHSKPNYSKIVSDFEQKLRAHDSRILNLPSHSDFDRIIRITLVRLGLYNPPEAKTDSHK